MLILRIVFLANQYKSLNQIKAIQSCFSQTMTNSGFMRLKAGRWKKKKREKRL